MSSFILIHSSVEHQLSIKYFITFKPGPKVIKTFSCSIQLRLKFKLLINTEIAKISRNSRLRSPRPEIYLDQLMEF